METVNNRNTLPENHDLKQLFEAAEQGDTQAQCCLSVMYTNGGGMPQNDVMAYIWANLAAAHGNEKARKLEDELRARMSDEEVAEGQKCSTEIQERIESSTSE